MKYNEEWKSVVGFEAEYEVSSYGRVRSLSRVLVNAQGQVRKWRGRVLKPQPDGHGYSQVSLRSKTSKTKKVYRLVAEAFIPLPVSDVPLVVNHRDGDKSNNHVGNLEWVTSKGNSAHAWSTGLLRARYGVDTSGAKLSDAQVLEIRLRACPYHPKNGIIPLSKEFGVHRQTIRDILVRRSWGHV